MTRRGVFLVRTDGSDDHEILTDLPGRHAHPDFSRDGKYLGGRWPTTPPGPGRTTLPAGHRTAAGSSSGAPATARAVA